MWDGWECYYGLDPLNASDKYPDLDGDGLAYVYEFNLGMDPLNLDTDYDGCCDRNDNFPLDHDIQ